MTIVGAASRSLFAPVLTEALSRSATLLLDPDGDADLGRLDAALASSHLTLDAATLAACERLRVVTQAGTAIHVDVAAATRLGIPVLHNPGTNADSVAEHTVGLLLAVVKQIPRSDAAVRRRESWEVSSPELVTSELRGRTLGLVGFGAIGSRVADIASRGLGMRVLVWTRTAGRAVSAGYPELELDDLLRAADVVSLHLAATVETVGLIDRRRLMLLPAHAWLVSTARAEVLDYVALDAVLRSGHLSGAALDTWPGHRADPQSPLIDLPNVVFTQHNAGLTHESAARMAHATAAGLDEVLDDRYPSSSVLVNREVWDRRRTAR